MNIASDIVLLSELSVESAQPVNGIRASSASMAFIHNADRPPAPQPPVNQCSTVPCENHPIPAPVAVPIPYPGQEEYWTV